MLENTVLPPQTNLPPTIRGMDSDSLHPALTPHLERLKRVADIGGGVVTAAINETIIENPVPIAQEDETLRTHKDGIVSEVAHEHTVKSSGDDLGRVDALSSAQKTSRFEDMLRLVRLSAITNPDSSYYEKRQILKFSEELEKMGPEKAKEFLEEERNARQLDGYRSEYLESHKLLVKEIRSIRQGQSAYIAEQMDMVPSGATLEERRHAFIKATQHSPDVSQRVLQSLNMVGDFGEKKRIINDNDAEKASQNPELFSQALDQILLSDAEVVLPNLNILKQVCDTKQLREAVDRMIEANPKALNSSGALIRIAGLYESREEQKEKITQYCEQKPELLMQVMHSEELIDLIGREKIRELCQKELRGEQGDQIGYYLANEMLENGFIEVDDFENMLVNIPEWSLEGMMTSGTLEPEKLLQSDSVLSEEAKKNLLQRFIDVAGIMHEIELARFFTSHPTIFNDAVKANIVINRIKSNFVENFDLCSLVGIDWKEHLDPQDVSVLLRQQMNEVEDLYLDFKIGSLFKVALKTGLIDVKEIQNCIESLSASTFSYMAFRGELEEYYQADEAGSARMTELLYVNLESLDPTERFRVVRATYHGGWENALKFLSIEECRAVIRENVENGNLLVGYDVKSALNAGIMNKSEIEQLTLRMLEVQLESNTDKYLSVEGLLGLVEKTLGAEQAQKYTIRLMQKRPDVVFSSLDSVVHLVDRVKIEEFVSNYVENPDNIQQIASSFVLSNSTWLRYSSEEKIINVLDSIPLEQLPNTLRFSNDIKNYIGQEKLEGYARLLLDRNPALAIQHLDLFQNFGMDISESEILSNAIARVSEGGIAEKYLSATMNRISKTDKTGTKSILLEEASLVYLMIDDLRSKGAEKQTRLIMENLSGNPSEEMDVLELAVSLVRLGGVDAMQSVDTVDSLSLALLEALSKELGVEVTVSQLATRRRKELQTLAVYSSQFIASTEHQVILKQLLQNIDQNSYLEWKYGRVSGESMETMKESGLIPKNITQEQFVLWEQDESTALTDVFSVEADSASDDIRITIEKNTHLLTEIQDKTVNVSERIVEVGQEIASTNKQLALLRKEPDQDMASEQIRQLEMASYELATEIKTLQVEQDLELLLGITADQLKSGKLAKSRDGKSVELDRTLGRLRKNIGQERVYIVDEMLSLVDSYRSQTGETRDLVVEDTGDLLTTLRIGVEPVGSCQNYRNGVMNDALVGYTDANTKILVLKNGKGSPVGRSIFRLLETKDGEPILHIDTFYGFDITDSAKRALIEHALSKAEKMGVRLVMSDRSQNNDGVTVEDRRIAGFAYEPYAQGKVQSSGSRAPYVYVDAAGGAKKNGKYSIGGLSLLSRN